MLKVLDNAGVDSTADEEAGPTLDELATGARQMLMTALARSRSMWTPVRLVSGTAGRRRGR